MQNSPDEAADTSARKRTICFLSLLAFSPVIILTAMLLATDQINAIFLPLLDGFKTASAMTLAFLGGVRWNAAMREDRTHTLALAAPMLPAIIGWFCLFLPNALSVGILLLTTCAMGAWDNFSIFSKADGHWYGFLRTVLTLISAFCHSIVLLVIL